MNEYCIQQMVPLSIHFAESPTGSCSRRSAKRWRMRQLKAASRTLPQRDAVCWRVGSKRRPIAATQRYVSMCGCSNEDSCLMRQDDHTSYHVQTCRRDKSKALDYYERMRSKWIKPPMHTNKLLIHTNAKLKPVNIPAEEAVLEDMPAAGVVPEAIHHASLIHAKGCVIHDMPGARALFDSMTAKKTSRPVPCLYQALFKSLNTNHQVTDSDVVVKDMVARRGRQQDYQADQLAQHIGFFLSLNILLFGFKSLWQRSLVPISLHLTASNCSARF
nr:pentatricopeptide repeat-containing protein 5, mitochondrial [Quercus suber]